MPDSKLKNHIKVAILTEGLQGTGYGHLTRCLSIYQAFEEKGINPLYIANCDETGKKFIPNINLLQLNWLGNEENLLQIIKDYDIAVIDSYLAPLETYEKIFNFVKKTVYIDDYIRLNYPPGIIVNGTIGAENLPYPKSGKHKQLLGIDYMPIRKEFWDFEVPERHNNTIKNVLITFGAQDIRNLSFQILDLLLEHYSNLNFHIVIGSGNQTNAISKYKRNNVTFYTSIGAGQMLELMLKCDIAITAAGQTMYELARVGLKTIAIGIADNQKNNMNGWLKRGFIKKEIWYNQINYIYEVSNSIKEIYFRDKNENSVFCDGLGARRIVDTLIDKRFDLISDIVLRTATFNDANIIYDLSNEEVVRQSSINRSPIGWETHLQWLKAKLDDINYKIYLFLLGNQFLGQVKFEIELPSAIISISIHRDFRGKGLSSIVLNRAIESFLEENILINSVVALIRPENETSIKSFVKSGFVYIRNETFNQEMFQMYEFIRKKNVN